MPDDSPISGGDAAGSSLGSSPAASPAAPATPDAPPSPPAPVPSIIGEPAPAPVTPPESLVNADGSFIPDWTAKLPDEEFGDFKSKLAGYKNPTEVARALKHANALANRKGVILPTPESTPEQVAEYRKAVGVPDTVEAYSEAVMPKIELPEGVQWNDGIAKEYFTLAHKHNIPPEAMKDLANLNAKQQQFTIKAVMDQVAEQKQTSLHQLRQHWGADFDRKIEVVKRAANRYGIDPNDPGWKSPEMVKFVARMAADMGEDKLAAPGGALPAGSADFRARARDIQTNPQNPNYAKYWAGDVDVQHMVREYLKKAG